MGKKRVLGNDRALMFLCAAARKYWRFYSPAYKQVKLDSHCCECGHKVDYVEVDHVKPLGSRPREFVQFSDWLERLFMGAVHGLCKKHHLMKTKQERKKNA